MKKLFITLILVLVATVVLALEYAVQENGSVKFKRGRTPFPPGAVFPITPELKAIGPGSLKIVNGILSEKTAEEKAVMKLPEKHRKIDEATGIWVERSQAEKDAADAAEEAAMAAAMETWQASKPVALKILENTYVSFLTNTWTSILRGTGLIEPTAIVNVTNTTESVNIGYLLTLQGMGTPETIRYYLDMSSQFRIFKSTITEYVVGTIGYPPNGEKNIMSLVRSHTLE